MSAGNFYFICEFYKLTSSFNIQYLTNKYWITCEKLHYLPSSKLRLVKEHVLMSYIFLATCMTYWRANFAYTIYISRPSRCYGQHTVRNIMHSYELLVTHPMYNTIHNGVIEHTSFVTRNHSALQLWIWEDHIQWSSFKNIANIRLIM